MQSTRPLAFASTLARATKKYPRPRPGTSERPPYRAPDPLNASNPNAVVTKLPEGNLELIHRPPPSAPSPFSLTTNPGSPLLTGTVSPVNNPLPPLLRKPKPQPEQTQTRMSDQDIVKMRNLRESDPFKYSRAKLAAMFGCSQAFVGQMAGLKKSQLKATHRVQNERHQRDRERWSERHSLVKAIRAKRKELW